MKAGKESYYIVSKFEHFEYAKVAPLFANLSRNFEQCVYGLNRVKNELQEMQHPIVRTQQRNAHVVRWIRVPRTRSPPLALDAGATPVETQACVALVPACEISPAN